MILTPTPGGELEYAVLDDLWRNGASTAREIHDRFAAERDLAYTTIAKVLDRLHDKKLVRREPVGRAFKFKAAMPRERVERARAKRTLANFLGDKPRPAIAALVEAIDDLDPSLLDELAKTIAKKRGRHGS